jgi:phosphocarrier protein HPr
MNDPPHAGEDDCPADPSAIPDGALVRVFTIINQRGLHARASAKFVKTVENFDADIWVSRCGETVGGTSIMGLMMLSAGPGATVSVTAAGKEAPQALAALEALINSRFGEED